jgi:hypothetical protein
MTDAQIDSTDFTVIDAPIAEALKQMQDSIDIYPPGETRDAMQAKYDRLMLRLKEAPERLAALGPVGSRDEALKLVHDELLYALRGWSGDS